MAELADAADSKSAEGNLVRVRLSPRASHPPQRLTGVLLHFFAQRSVIVLHYYLDLSLSDAAESLGIPLGTMKSRLSRATQALRAAIESQERASAMATGGIA